VSRPRVDPATALALHAGRSPEAPFLFFRDPRGQFGWWSWARCRAVLSDAEAGGLEAGAAAARDFLVAVLALPQSERECAAALLAELGEGARRDVWLTCGDLAAPGESALALAAIGGGWAVVHEPAPAIHPATFLWARPTIAGGTVGALALLLDACERQAPRWRAGAWLARRLRRLRALAVVGGGDTQPLVARLAALRSPARLLSNPPAGW
jgi:hypothetical protein